MKASQVVDDSVGELDGDQADEFEEREEEVSASESESSLDGDQILMQKAGLGEVFAIRGYGDFDEDESLEDTLVRLATEYNRKKSRKERKEQRAVFRDIHSTVTDGDQASMSVNLGGMQVTFSGWCPRVQLNALRSCLSSGFQTHLQHNTTVREILNLTASRSKVGTRIDSAQSRSGCTGARTVWRASSARRNEPRHATSGGTSRMIFC